LVEWAEVERVDVGWIEVEWIGSGEVEGAASTPGMD
jgi:hypothetical protein